MRKIPILAVLVLGAVAASSQPPVASASSHREAPFATKNPKTDGTDFYMFNSYETGRGAFTTIIADYQPFQDSWGGPNYFNMDPDALYEIMLDNTGDANEDITFQFQFSQVLANAGAGITLAIGADAGGGTLGPVAIPLVAAGPITASGMADPSQNVIETYTLNMVTGNRRTGTSAAVKNASGGSTTFAKPMDNIGTKTFADYKTYANSFVFGITIPGCATAGKVFVGQRAEPFAVNIGPIFDLIDAPVGVITSAADRAAVPNPLQCKNVTSIALELPTSCITTTTGTSKGILGGWTTASVRQARVINPSATYAKPTVEGGPWAQVSRLGMPLVNEAVIGLPDKDTFNSSEPSGDAKFPQLVTYAEYPTLPALIEVLFGKATAPAPPTPRVDLLTVFALGVTGVNANGATAEYLRLNTAIPATPAASQNNLGAAGCFTAGVLGTCGSSGTPYACDCAGFPNGRRPGDDVVDVVLRVAEGYLLTTPAPTSAVPFTDAVLQDPSQFDVTFPYLTTPNGGAAAGGATPACTGVP